MTNIVVNEWVVTDPPEALDAMERDFVRPPRPAPPLPPWPLRLLTPAPPMFAPELDFSRIVLEPEGLEGEALATWRAAHWRVRSQGEGGPPDGYGRVAPERADVRVGTPWTYPIGIMEAVATRLPPGVTVEGTYVEEGVELAGRFHTADGRLHNEEEPRVESFPMILSGPWMSDT